MAKKRGRAQRTFFLLLALGVLLFLLELNRFLPGTWAGGSGGGFRTSSTVVRMPDPAAPETPPTDPTALAPPETPPPSFPPPEGLRVEVRAPDGSLQDGWRVGTGSGGSDLKPDASGTVRARDPRLADKGFRVNVAGGKLRHEHGLKGAVRAWIVHLPEAKLPAQRTGARAGLQVVDAVTGEAVEGATVTWQARGRRQSATADATGEAVVEPEYGEGVVRVRVAAKGYATRYAWASPRDPSLRETPLVPVVSKRVRFVTEEGTLASVDSVTVLDAEGRPLRVGDPDPGRDVQEGHRRIDVPAPAAAGAWVEVTARRAGRPGTYRFRLPFSALEGDVRLPPAEELVVEVRDANGTLLKDARVEAEVLAQSETGGRGGVVNASAPGSAPDHLAVPAGQPFRLRVEAPGRAPIVRRYARGDGNAPLAFVLEDGIEIPVRITTEEGVAAPLATLVARAAQDGAPIVRRAKADVTGRGSVGPFAPGPVEVFAVGRGRSWGAAVVQARPGMGTVEVALDPGFPLELVVEDPFGVPLAGVAVEITPSDGGPPLIAAPTAEPWQTDEGGVLRVEHLPNRRYTVRLSAPGHHAETLRGVRPGAVKHFATLVRR